jgi:hypothetical protein
LKQGSFDASRSKGEMPQAHIRGIEDGVSDGSGSDGNCSVSCAVAFDFKWRRVSELFGFWRTFGDSSQLVLQGVRRR